MSANLLGSALAFVMASVARAFASSFVRVIVPGARRLPWYMTSRCFAPNISRGGCADCAGRGVGAGAGDAAAGCA